MSENLIKTPFSPIFSRNIRFRDREWREGSMPTAKQQLDRMNLEYLRLDRRCENLGWTPTLVAS